MTDRINIYGESDSIYMNHNLNLNMFHRLYFAFMAVLTLLCSCSSDRPDSLEPHLQTLQATDITRTEATISGVCQTDKGTQMPQLWFRYGTDESMSERSDVLDNVDGSVSMRLAPHIIICCKAATARLCCPASLSVS